METVFCGKCEGAADAVDLNGAGLCEWCAGDVAFLEARGSLFALADGTAFVGHDTGETWNGFAVPAFDFDEALAVLRYLEVEGFARRVHVTDSDTLTLTFEDWNGDTVDVIADEAGRYVFDGFTWQALEFDARALEAVEARFSAPIPFDKLRSTFDPFRDELLDAWHADELLHAMALRRVTGWLATGECR